MSSSEATPLNEMRGDYDWEEVFRYAKGGDMQGQGPDIRRAAPVGDEECGPERVIEEALERVADRLDDRFQRVYRGTPA